MNRAERRRAERKDLKKEKTYVLTESQIEMIKKEAATNAIDTAFTLLLAIPLKVLLKYWPKTAKKKLPKFLDEVMDMYNAYNNDKLTMKELREDLYEYGGITLNIEKSIQHF